MILLVEGLGDKESDEIKSICQGLLKNSISHFDDIESGHEQIPNLSQALSVIDPYLVVEDCFFTLPLWIVDSLFNQFEIEQIKVYCQVVLRRLKGMDRMVSDGWRPRSEEIYTLRLIFEFLGKNGNIFGAREDEAEIKRLMEELETELPDFEEYENIFDIICNLRVEDNQLFDDEGNLHESGQENETVRVEKAIKSNRMALAEWIKFALSMNIQEEVTRRFLVNKMQNFILNVKHSYNDYAYLLTQKRLVLDD
jgi:hypothetical protein